MKKSALILATMGIVAQASAGEVANRFAASTLRDWTAMSTAQKTLIVADLARDVPEKDRRVSTEKLAANVNECLDHLAADDKYTSSPLGTAYKECIGPAARDFQ